MLDEAGLDFLFRDARSQKAWTDRPVDEALLRRIYDLMILGSTKQLLADATGFRP